MFNDFNLGISYMNGLRNPTYMKCLELIIMVILEIKILNLKKSNTYEVYSNILLNENINLSLRAFKANIKNNIEYISNKYQNDSDDIDLNQSGYSNQINFKLKNTNLNFFTSFLSSKRRKMVLVN